MAMSQKVKLRLMRHDERVDAMLSEFEEARMVAVSKSDASAMVKATMGKIKVLGLDKQLIDLSSSDGSMSPKSNIDMSKLSSEALLELIEATKAKNDADIDKQ